jgi:alkanesulfonate monooxygenase SsuD/methylene tetrahydromethanopterin reductase-like flavin-dependent oxidoreductase (luciferase family)
MLTKMRRAGRLELFKTSRDMPDDEVTLDFVCDKLVTWGTPDKVADELLAFREEVGAFGTMLYAGHDWADRELGRRSMVLLAEKVLPQVNAASRNRAEAAE